MTTQSKEEIIEQLAAKLLTYTNHYRISGDGMVYDKNLGKECAERAATEAYEYFEPRISELEAAVVRLEMENKNLNAALDNVSNMGHI